MGTTWLQAKSRQRKTQSQKGGLLQERGTAWGEGVRNDWLLGRREAKIPAGLT